MTRPFLKLFCKVFEHKVPRTFENFEGKEDYSFTQDPCGSFKIMVKDGIINAVHYKNMEVNISIQGKTSKAVYDVIIKQGLISRIEHATYLGAELEKAEIAAKLGKNYTQDFSLF